MFQDANLQLSIFYVCGYSYSLFQRIFDHFLIELPIDMRLDHELQWLYGWKGMHVRFRAKLPDSNIDEQDRLRELANKYPLDEYQISVQRGRIHSDIEWHVQVCCKLLSDPKDVGTVVSVPARFLIVNDRKQAMSPTGPPIFCSRKRWWQ